MAALHPNLRKKLEKAVVKARDTAEKAAKSALQSLAVDSHQPFDHMSPEQRQFRVKLRARGRAIGDRIDAKGKQGLWHLILEAAYEHWHRMLFARFLAENNLLMHPDGVAVTLDECEELAAEEGLDKWELASRYAAKMLPAIFRPDDPVLQIEFAPEDKLGLERLLTDLEPEIFDADDSLGWVYQFWQTKRKDEVNASETKIGADELPAVTQLFTDDYMVKFLLHNTLGAWWAGKFLAANTKIAQDKELTEDDLRKAVTFDNYDFDYLRFIFEEDDKIWKPAAGCFDGWPKEAKDITVLDPCCGSGHFLVAVFELMVRIRMAEEGISPKEAVDGVLKENLFGLEIDIRCTQIAAFALAFTAWNFPNAEGFRELPQLNIACSGIPVTTKKEDWLRLAEGKETIESGIERLWHLFRNADVLGSLVEPTAGGDQLLIEASFDQLRPLVEQALETEREIADFDFIETAVIAQGISRAAKLLSGRYTLTITNVPYLIRGKQSESLKNFCKDMYPESKTDLATTFLERCIEFAKPEGTSAMVILQNWLFQATNKKLRRKLLTTTSWEILARLGPGAFETISGEVVNVALVVISSNEPFRDKLFLGLDATENRTTSAKSQAIKCEKILKLKQLEQLSNPELRILLREHQQSDLLIEHAIVSEGLHTGDYPQFGRNFWEVGEVNDGWSFQLASTKSTNFYGGRGHIMFWENGEGKLIEFVQKRLGNQSTTMWIKGDQVWGRSGVAVSAMGDLRATLYTGEIFIHSVFVAVPKEPSNLPALWAYLSSNEFQKEVRMLDKKVCVARAAIENVPFDLIHWQKIAEKKYPNGLPEPYSEDPTQWIFKGTVNDTIEPLQVAISRLLGYHWPEQTNDPEIDELVDEDGIVCIGAVGGEQPAADRLRAILADAFGSEWSPAKETELLSGIDSGRGLEDWLRNKFFIQHCKLFHNQPFIWHIWDGERNGFAALVNYHKLDKKTMETLTYSYLGDWINKQRADFEAGIGPAETKMLAAQVLQKKLELILRGEKPYDIFVRWKPIYEQPVGWEPDQNDGVRMNIRPFFEADVLRKKPNIKWTKDRGKEPTREKERYPWYYDDRGFIGDRVNDIHLSLKEKQEAREKAAKEGSSK
ncbi:Eco57I restriction-modification methylase domain-containing protein [Planctomycetota bacterium]